jgi:hypothetical protein
MWGTRFTGRGSTSADKWAYFGNHPAASEALSQFFVPPSSSMDPAPPLSALSSPSLSLLHRLAFRMPPLGTAPPLSSSSPGSSRRHSSSCPRPQVTCDSFRCHCISPSRTREISVCSRHGRCLQKVDPPAPKTASLAPPRVARHSPCTNPDPRCCGGAWI